MSPGTFRILLVSSIVFGLCSALVDAVFPSLLPAAFASAQEDQDSSLSNWALFATAALALVALVAGVVAAVGLYLFRSWAPRLALATTALAVLLMLSVGAVAQSAAASALAELSSVLWGAVLAVTYYSPLAKRFEPGDA